MKAFKKYCALFLVFLIFMFPKDFSAQNISEEVILTVAQNFFSEKFDFLKPVLQKQTSIDIENNFEIKSINTDSYLGTVVKLSPKGFVILSNNRSLSPIIAYSFHNDWNNDTSSTNTLLQILKFDLSNRLEHLDEIPVEIQEKNKNLWDYYQAGNNSNDYQQDFRQWPKVGTTTTGGWIETTWHQTEPYNQFCPIDPTTNERSVIGCGALAVAQIVNYHQFFNNKRFTIADRYNNERSPISIDADSTVLDFPSFYELNLRLDTLQFKYDNNFPLNDRDYAALNFAIGIMTDMEYSSSESATGLSALYKVFSIDMLYHSADFVFDKDILYEGLIENMKDGLPAEISMFSSNGGHAAVCDGYNTDDYYHINFGWGANSPKAITDCWYDLAEELPHRFNLSTAILNIKPKGNLSLFTVPDSLIKFAPTLINTNSEIQVIRLRNEGSVVISIDEIVIPKYFRGSLDGSKYYNRFNQIFINPKSEIQLNIICKPDSIGKFENDLEITITRGKLRRFKRVGLLAYGSPETGTLITDKYVFGVWNASASPYIIVDDVFVKPGGKLSVMPGTSVKILNNCDFTIGEDAQFIAMGIETDSIYFTSLNPSHGCNGLRFVNSIGDDTLSYCVFDEMGNESVYGGALNIFSTNLFIKYSSFANNLGQNGGAIYLTGSKPNIENTIFVLNKAEDGGAIYILSSEPIIKNNRFSDNQATNGGAISSTRSSFEIIENNFYKNRSSNYGGVIFASHSNLSIKNSIMDSNLTNIIGSILACEYTEIFFQNITAVNYTSTKLEDLFALVTNNTIEVKNSIFWSSLPIISKSEPGNYNSTESITNTFKFHFNNCDPTFLNNTSEQHLNTKFTWGPNNISKEPKFIDFENKDFRLQESSPCVDASDPHDDVELEPFPHGYQRNLGAYGGTEAACTTSILKLVIDPYQINFTKEIFTFSLKNGCSDDINITNLFTNDSTFIKFMDFPFQNNSFVLKSGEIKDFRLKFYYSLFTGSIFEPFNTEIIIKTIELPEVSIPIQIKYFGIDLIGTKIKGEISGVLDKENSPYLVVSDLSIRPVASLLIEPGVKLYFSENTGFSTGIGKLLAVGTEKDSIHFIAKDSLGWNGISTGSKIYDIKDTIQYCIIRDADKPIHASQSGPIISNCLFKNNVNHFWGIIFLESIDNFKISNCRFEHNKSGQLSGIINAWNSSGIIENTIFYKNSETCIKATDSKVDLINLTFSNNSSSSSLIELYRSQAVIKNSIIEKNLKPPGSIIWAKSAKVTIESSNIDTTSVNWIYLNESNPNSFGELIWGEGNISADPMFVDLENGDLTLRAGSPCIDAGNPNDFYNDNEDPFNPGLAKWPAKGTIRNDMGAYGGNAHHNYVTSVEDLKEKQIIPTSYSLSQNYPNPFNPSTIIRYSIPSRTVMLNSFQHLDNEIPDPSSAGGQARNDNVFVQLKVYDILGREVATLVNKKQIPGNYSVQFNATYLTSGIYFYRLITGDYVNTKKMLILK